MPPIRAARPCSIERLNRFSGPDTPQTLRREGPGATSATPSPHLSSHVPVEQLEPPTTPFESIAADFCDLAGVHYLVTVDRLSGWLDVTRAAPGTAGSGAKGLIACLPLLFADKGVPEILSSDGGTEFTSAETQALLKTWQVKHRLSSAHFPQLNGRAGSCGQIGEKAPPRPLLAIGTLGH